MKKKLSLFMIVTAAVVGLSLATPENQTVSANAQAVQNCENGCCDRPFFGYCGPFSWFYYNARYFLGYSDTTTNQ
ncbi:TPA: hypothetical protein VB507_001385 [Streptococcus pyogenes]|nr:hypothetical protein [Streptococcus pyogenes]